MLSVALVGAAACAAVLGIDDRVGIDPAGSNGEGGDGNAQW
jgi:hypothetical protein